MMKIRIPKSGELENIRAFLLYVIKNDFGYEHNPEWHWDIDKLSETYLDNPRSLLLVAIENNEVVGTIAVRPYDKNFAQLEGRYSKENTAGIWRHYVKKELRGKGIGKKLFEEVEKRLFKMGYGTMYLHTQKTVPGSLEYWKKRGFIVTVDVGDDMGTVHMEKKL